MSTGLDHRPGSAARPSRPQRDVVALVFGLVFTGVAGTALWNAYVGRLTWSAISTAAPLTLVAIGVVGLLLSRRH